MHGPVRRALRPQIFLLQFDVCERVVHPMTVAHEWVAQGFPRLVRRAAPVARRHRGPTWNEAGTGVVRPMGRSSVGSVLAYDGIVFPLRRRLDSLFSRFPGKNLVLVARQ